MLLAARDWIRRYALLDSHSSRTKIINSDFVCSDECWYEADFSIFGLLGEEPTTIKATGIGSYDEKYKDELALVVEP